MVLESIIASALTPVVVVCAACAALSSTSAVQPRHAIGGLHTLATLAAVAVWATYAHTSPSTSGFVFAMLLLTLVQALTPTTIALAGRGLARSYSYLVFVSVISVAGLALVCATSHLGLVIAFELMLFGALGLLRLTAKAERGVEALVEMYVWSVVGSFALVVSLWVRAFSGLAGHETISSLALLLGFAVKIPLWPCSSWLLKAHVEASTEFSILLSGFLVKFGVIGLYRSLTLCGYSEAAFAALRVMAWVGVVESAVRLYQQVDLKRLIATLTILETNWLVLCLCGDSTRSVGLGVALVLVHCWTTTTEFYLVELLYRRYSSRSTLRVSGVWWSSPNLARLAWIVLLITLGLPGTSIFALKLMFMAHVSTVSTLQLIFFCVVMLVIVPVALIRVWVPVLCGQVTQASSSATLTRVEVSVVGCCVLAGLVIGLCPALVTL